MCTKIRINFLYSYFIPDKEKIGPNFIARAATAKVSYEKYTHIESLQTKSRGIAAVSLLHCRQHTFSSNDTLDGTCSTLTLPLQYTNLTVQRI